MFAEPWVAELNGGWLGRRSIDGIPREIMDGAATKALIADDPRLVAYSICMLHFMGMVPAAGTSAGRQG